MAYTAKNSLKAYMLNKIVSKLLWLFNGEIITVRKKDTANSIEYIVFTAGELDYPEKASVIH